MSQPCLVNSASVTDNRSLKFGMPALSVKSLSQGVSPLDSLGEAYANFSVEKANLIACTQHADSLIAAALSQLQHKPDKAACNNTVRKEAAVEATKLKQRNSALAKKLSSALENSHALKKQILEQAEQMQRLKQAHDDRTQSLQKVQADNSRLTGLCSKLSNEALLLVDQVQKSLDSPTAVWPHQPHATSTPPQPQPPVAAPSCGDSASPQSPLHHAAAPSTTAVSTQVKDIDPDCSHAATTAAASAGAAAAAAASDYTIAAVRAVKQAPRQYSSLPTLLSHQPCFSMGVDWSAIPLQHPTAEQQRGAKFMPGSSVQNFECHKEKMAAYLTTQQGLRDGKRRRLASGMLAQCLVSKRTVPPTGIMSQPGCSPPCSSSRLWLEHAPCPAREGAGCVRTAAQVGAAEQLPPSRGHSRSEQGAELAPGGGSLAGSMQPGGQSAGSASTATIAAACATAVGCLSPVPTAKPAAMEEAGLPSRTPKRKRSLRDEERWGQQGPGVQSELEVAFQSLATTVDANKAPQQRETPHYMRDAVVQPGAATGQGQVYKTFELYDNAWYGGLGVGQGAGRKGMKSASCRGCIIS